MMITIETLASTPIAVYRWDSIHNAKGVIQIIHGMSEYSGRYSPLAHFLNSKGWIVVAQDLIGHGKNIEHQAKGHWLKKGWQHNKAVITSLNTKIRDQYPDKPIFLLGQGLGATFVQDFINTNSQDIQGAILAGANGSPGIATTILYWLAILERVRRGSSSPSQQIHRLTNNAWNQYLPETETQSWLNHDADVRETYSKDPLCGFVCSCSLWSEVLYNTVQVHKNNNHKKIDPKIALLILAGSQDPIGEQGIGVHRLMREYTGRGLSNIQYSLYAGFRHELFIGKDTQRVFSDLHLWLEENT